MTEQDNQTQPGIWKFNGVEQLLVRKSGKSDAGMTIISDQELCIQATFYHKGTFTVMPLSDNDTNFVIPSYYPYYGAEFAVFAGSDNTSIRIRTPHNNNMITERLNKGEVYMIKGTVDLTGSSVASNKPVAVFSSVHARNHGSYSGYMITQVPSVSSLGITYVIPQMPFRRTDTRYNFIRVIPATNRTQIQYWSGHQHHNQQTVNAGRFLEIYTDSSSAVMVVHCSSPCLVVQYNLKHKYGYNTDGTYSPFMLVIPPTSLYRNRFRWTTKAVPHIEEYIDNHANIIIKRGNFSIQKSKKMVYNSF